MKIMSSFSCRGELDGPALVGVPGDSPVDVSPVDPGTDPAAPSLQAVRRTRRGSQVKARGREMCMGLLLFEAVDSELVAAAV